MTSRCCCHLLRSRTGRTIHNRVRTLATSCRGSGLRFVGGPIITRFLKLSPGDSFARAGLRTSVVARVRGFIVRLNGKCTFITQRRRVHASVNSCFVSLIFCGCVLGYFLLISLGASHVARRSMNRVSVCMEVCSRLGHARNSGPAVNLVLYSRADRSVTQCSIVRSGRHLFRTGCLAFLPAMRRLHRRVRLRGDIFRSRRKRWPPCGEGSRAGLKFSVSAGSARNFQEVNTRVLQERSISL